MGPAGVRALLAALLLATGCAFDDHHHTGDEHHHAEQAEIWSVTAWGELYEIFPEVDLLAAGDVATAHTHVTLLDGFAPMIEGAVEIVLSGPGGDQVFRADEPVRPGIFNVDLRPETAGEHELSFRVSSPAGSEEIPGGTVRVGTGEAPGGLVAAPASKGATVAGEPLAGEPLAGEPLDFLKEEQWRSDFATARVRRGTLARSVAGFAKIRAPAGGEATLSSPVDGVLRPEPWPYPGRRVETGEPLFRVVPRIAADRSLPALEAELVAYDTDLGAARVRLSRLEELLALEAASQREVEEARARVATLEARHTAAARDLEAARSARQGGASAALTLRAPFGGEIASVAASPGGTVAAGDALARLVRTDLLWLEVALAPAAARQLAAEGVTPTRGQRNVIGVVLTFPEGPTVRLQEGLRLVSVAPEVDPATGTVTALLEATSAPGLILGTAATAQILLAETSEGVVVPASAVVDDGGVQVVYLQLSGESFARQEIHVLERQGDQLLVDRLVPGQRLVTRGGVAIRRASLMASGEAQQHVH